MIKTIVYFNYTKDAHGYHVVPGRDYTSKDDLHLVWDGYLDYEFIEDAAWHIYKELNALDKYSVPKILGLRDMYAGDVVYFPIEEVALAKTENGWSIINDFKVPPMGPHGINMPFEERRSN